VFCGIDNVMQNTPHIQPKCQADKKYQKIISIIADSHVLVATYERM
jgi:hypothetical protein